MVQSGEDYQQENIESCADVGHLKCHPNAECMDNQKGFCCVCSENWYGNGYSCIKSDVPIRVSGKISGHIGGKPITSQLQAYVMLADGRTYAAISPLEAELGYSLQLLHVLASPIGWLFAKPHDNTKNGYQVKR